MKRTVQMAKAAVPGLWSTPSKGRPGRGNYMMAPTLGKVPIDTKTLATVGGCRCRPKRKSHTNRTQGRDVKVAQLRGLLDALYTQGSALFKRLTNRSRP